MKIASMPCCGGDAEVSDTSGALIHECIPPVIRLRAVLPTDHAARNEIPLCTGCWDYFPLALAEVAKLSKVANEQHNPGQPMHWARGKSTAHADKIMKHLVDRGTLDSDGMRHSAKVAWRALALLQTELEEAGGTPGRASVFPQPVKEI